MHILLKMKFNPFKWFRKIPIKMGPLLPKDPKDFTLTKSSTPWHIDEYFCAKCLNSTSHEEYMADVCNSCGEMWAQRLYGRSVRKIWNGQKWIWQYKYKWDSNLPDSFRDKEFVLSETKLHS